MARYSGNGSWDNLIINIYNLLVSHWVNNADQPSLGRRELDNSLVALPFHFLRAGYYNYNIGNVYFRNSYGYYWNSYIRSKIIASDLRIFTTSLYPRNTDNFAHGNSVRCVTKFATDSICPKGWEMARRNGNKNYNKLLFETYSNKSTYSLAKSNSGNGVIILPMNFIYSGEYIDEQGKLDKRNTYGNIRGASITEHYLNNRALELLISSTHLSVTNWTRGMGYSVRWGGKLNFSGRRGFFYDGVKDFVNIEAGFARNGNNIGLFAAK